MLRAELLVLKEWLEENMSRGFLGKSSFPFAATGLFEMQPGGGVLLCIDYRDITSKTVRNSNPLALVEEKMNLHWVAHIHGMIAFWEASRLL